MRKINILVLKFIYQPHRNIIENENDVQLCHRLQISNGNGSGVSAHSGLPGSGQFMLRQMSLVVIINMVNTIIP